MAMHNELGKEGEELATAYLIALQFEILQRNWRFSHFEIDIVAVKKEVLHFIEVKARQSNHYGFPEESITMKKINNMLNAGEAYQLVYPQYKWVQYDVLSIMIQNGEAVYSLIEDVYL